MTGKLRKNACKITYLGSIFIPEKYVIMVLFVSPWTSLIPPLAIRVAPQGFQKHPMNFLHASSIYCPAKERKADFFQQQNKLDLNCCCRDAKPHHLIRNNTSTKQEMICMQLSYAGF